LGCHCESVANSSLRQPIHSLACIGYILIGLYALVDALLPGRDLTVSSSYGALFGLCCIAVGLTGGLYHASLTEMAEACSWQAEASLLLCLHLFHAECLRWAPSAVSMYRQIYPGPKEIATTILSFIGGNGALWAMQSSFPALRDPRYSPVGLGSLGVVVAVVLWLGGVVIGERRYPQSRGRKRHVRFAALLIGAALLVRLYGAVRCDPGSMLQYGAMGDILTATAAASVYSWIQRWSDDMILTYERHAD